MTACTTCTFKLERYYTLLARHPLTVSGWTVEDPLILSKSPHIKTRKACKPLISVRFQVQVGCKSGDNWLCHPARLWSRSTTSVKYFNYSIAQYVFTPQNSVNIGVYANVSTSREMLDHVTYINKDKRKSKCGVRKHASVCEQPRMKTFILLSIIGRREGNYSPEWNPSHYLTERV